MLSHGLIKRSELQENGSFFKCILILMGDLGGLF